MKVYVTAFELSSETRKTESRSGTKVVLRSQHCNNSAAELCDFSGVNIANSFKEALIFDIPVKKVSAQIQKTPGTTAFVRVI